MPRRETIIHYAFLLPAAAWVMLFTLFPLLYGAGLSLFNVKIGAPDEFVGLANFAEFFRDPRALQSVRTTLVFVVCAVTVQMAGGLGLALLFNRPMPLRGLMRTLVTLPMFATPIAVGLLFFTIFYEEGGLINGTFNLHIPWLSDPLWAMVSIILVDVWQWTPFCFLIFLASLQGIPDDYYHAAQLETSSAMAVFFRVTFPILRPTALLVLLLRITEAFKIFDIPFTLTNGGPGAATQVLSMYAYRTGMRSFNHGYASSISFILFIVVLAVIMFSFRRVGEPAAGRN